MPTFASLTTMVSASLSQGTVYATHAIMAVTNTLPTAMAPSSSPAAMNGTRLLRNSDVRSTTALKYIMKFMYEGVQLPEFLAPYAGLFTSLLAGALGGSALYAYLHRHQANRAKVKMAVFHVLHVLQRDPAYNALLQDAEELLKRIDAEVMRLVGDHLTTTEASDVTKDVKRNFAHLAAEEREFKRARQVKLAATRQRLAARPQFVFPNLEIRGFLPPSWDSPLEPDDDFVRRELGWTVDEMDVDSPSPPRPLPRNSRVPPSFPGCFPSSPSAQQSILPMPASPSPPSPSPAVATAQVIEGLPAQGRKREGYGLDYSDSELYSSDDESDDESVEAAPSGPPPVVRQCDGKKCAGTSLSQGKRDPIYLKARHHHARLSRLLRL